MSGGKGPGSLRSPQEDDKVYGGIGIDLGARDWQNGFRLLGNGDQGTLAADNIDNVDRRSCESIKANLIG